MKNTTNNFVGFVLLKESVMDYSVVSLLDEHWEITCTDVVEDKENLTFKVDNFLVTVALMPTPVPNNEAEQYVKTNYMWRNGADSIEGYSAHFIVTVLSDGDSDDGSNDLAMKKGTLFVKVLSCLGRYTNAIGIMSSGTVFQPDLYKDLSGYMHYNKFPISNLVWFGIYKRDGKISGYTNGLRSFNKEEVEILDTDLKMDEMRESLFYISLYVVENNAILRDGQSLGFTADFDVHTISRNDGVAHNFPTLKIKKEF